LAVKVNGKTLRESWRDGEKTVFLPYGTEYSLLLKNNNNHRALAKITIDGMDAIQNGVVIRESGSVELERFLLDGDLSRGKRFRFVSLDHPDVGDPSSPYNGLVEVEFTEELAFKMDTKVYVPPQEPAWPKEWQTTYWSNANDFSPRGDAVKAYHATTGGLSGGSVCSSDAGATVEGSESNQVFGTTRWGMSGCSESLRVRLRAGKSPVLVSDTRYKYCPECGRKSKRGNRYCPHCGHRLDY